MFSLRALAGARAVHRLCLPFSAARPNATASSTSSIDLLSQTLDSAASQEAAEKAEKKTKKKSAAVAGDGTLGVAHLRGVHGSPQKFNVIAKMIRGLNYQEAIEQLLFCRKQRLARWMRGAVESAKANAESNHGADPKKLVLSKVMVTKAKVDKRLAYHSKGRAGIKHKRHAHITIQVKEGEVRTDQRGKQKYGKWGKTVQARERAEEWNALLEQGLPKRPPALNA